MQFLGVSILDRSRIRAVEIASLISCKPADYPNYRLAADVEKAIIELCDEILTRELGGRSWRLSFV